ncbi:hypothetical protein THIOM_000019 [Candidatus Thiomargarita nelsonii]|uniref:Uncharacterized protein n=1 Tax=Candidatus Thiomargarita nelsonii TaxID=1003181 RepID=A0A0A6P1M0_9GAMM|nr:hypothetical protein THIOM_000019 [Candidatus Thiomargarita nelsonii]
MKKGKGQLAEYLKSEGLDEGYYVVFSNLHTNTLYFEEEIKSRRIYTYIICTHFPTPSRLPVPEELKQVTQTELITRRRSLLDVLVLRFDPPSSLYRQIEQDLLNFTDKARLKKLLAVQSEDMTAFQRVMENL